MSIVSSRILSRLLKRRAVRNRLILYGTASLVALAMLTVHHFWVKRPPGHGPAGPQVPLEPFENPWTERPVLLVGLGDSITEGFGVAPAHSYVGRLAHNPPDEWADMQGRCLAAALPNLTVMNRATSGSTSLTHAASQVPRLPPQGSDVFGVVVMTTGGNDIIHSYGRQPPCEGAMYGATAAQAQPWVEKYRVRLNGMLNDIEAKFPGGCAIFLANIYDPTDGIGTARVFLLPSWPDGLKVLKAYNDVIAEAASKRPNVRLIDLHTLFMGHGVTCTQWWRDTYRSEDPYHWYGEVFEDPNDRGYDAVRRVFLNEMIRVLPERLRASETAAANETASPAGRPGARAAPLR